MTKETKFNPAIMVDWFESERGWGRKPDGVTLHLSTKDAQSARDKHLADEKIRNPSGATPDYYWAPESANTMIAVDDEIFEQIKEANKDGHTSLPLSNKTYGDYRSSGRIKSGNDL